MHVESKMGRLVGKTIRGVEVGEGETLLAFRTDQGVVAFWAEGDCCSESWFADITGFDALDGGTVAEVQEVSMEGYDVEDGRGRQESDEAYGYKIRTDKGWATIVFRNSSNGYYGGSLADHSGDLPGEMRPITDDWSA